MEERLEAEQLVARADQALRERGKGVDRKLVRELKNQMSAVAKCVTRIKPDKLDEGQLERPACSCRPTEAFSGSGCAERCELI